MAVLKQGAKVFLCAAMGFDLELVPLRVGAGLFQLRGQQIGTVGKNGDGLISAQLFAPVQSIGHELMHRQQGKETLICWKEVVPQADMHCHPPWWMGAQSLFRLQLVCHMTPKGVCIVRERLLTLVVAQHPEAMFSRSGLDGLNDLTIVPTLL